eukprot:Hpha_TRINITY_DN22095_c0_g1::TRINITY_DN22095_c0_g1_i1::g.112152::m.112152
MFRCLTVVPRCSRAPRWRRLREARAEQSGSMHSYELLELELPRSKVSREDVNHAPLPNSKRGLSHLEGDVKRPEGVEIETEVDNLPEAPLPEPSGHDDNLLEYESVPLTWEKAIQNGMAVSSDEFARKNFVLDAFKPHPHTNLFVQIIVQALEEARALDIVVIDVSNKWYFFPNHHDHFFNDTMGQHKIDMKIYCCGKTARHIEVLAHAVVDKIKKGLIPGTYSKKSLKVDGTMEEVFWFLNVSCGHIMVEIMHPMRREWRMRERRDVCMKVADSNMFVEDLLADGGWVKLWDHWTPVSSSMPDTEYEYVYSQERSHGWERIDVLKPQYCVTLRDQQRRSPYDAPLISEKVNFDNPSADDVNYIRSQLRERKLMLASTGAMESMGAELLREKDQAKADGQTVSNYEWETGDLEVSDKEVFEWIDRMKEDMQRRPMVYESEEQRKTRDEEWVEYSRRREARIRRFGYYDWVELQNDLQRGVIILPEGPFTWDPEQPPEMMVEPHPENYKGKPRDTKWGPGWYDV